MKADPKHLMDALTAVDWAGNVRSFCKDSTAVQQVANLNLKLAIWSKQFEAIESTNPAICFVREMQVSGHLVASSTALASYKLAAAAMRTTLETALYYSYFRTHERELATLVRSDKWYMSKAEIIEYHVTHTIGFNDVQKCYPCVALLNPWYSKISAIVHGQLPGKWLSQQSISDMKPNLDLQALVVETFSECIEIVHRLFLVTVGRELWQTFSPAAKKALIHGLSGDVKSALGLDSA